MKIKMKPWKRSFSLMPWDTGGSPVRLTHATPNYIKPWQMHADSLQSFKLGPKLHSNQLPLMTHRPQPSN